MNSLIKLVISYQDNNEDILFEEIVEKLNKLIIYNIRKIPITFKEDIYQELLLGLYNVIINFKINYSIEIPKEVLKNDKLDNKINNKYLIGFIKKYQIDINEIDNINLFIKEYILFCNENQLIFYINKRFKSLYISFQQKQINEIKRQQEYFEQLELIDNRNYLDIKNVNEDDYAFLLLFIEKGNVLTQKDVAIKLGITQQAVSKKMKKIKEKYKKRKV